MGSKTQALDRTGYAALLRDGGKEDRASVIRLAEDGNAAALAAVCEVFDETPETWGVFGGNLSQTCERVMLRSPGVNPLLGEAIRRHVGRLRQELCGANPTALEALLVDNVVLTWLQATMLDNTEAHNLGREKSSWTRFHAETREKAHKRFLAAVRTLATVRRLALPVLLAQVNVAAPGSQQANVTMIGGTDGSN